MKFPLSAAATGLAALLSTSAGATHDPYADTVVSFDQGAFNEAELAQSMFNDPLTTLGPPERFTGEAFLSQGGLFNSQKFNYELNRLGWDGWEVVST